MDCVEDYGYENLSLSRVMARVFSLKSTPLNIWVMWVYIVWVSQYMGNVGIYSMGRDLVY